jgi:hypothetical protein
MANAWHIALELEKFSRGVSDLTWDASESQPAHHTVLVTLVHAQDIGDNIAQIAALDDHVGHGLMRSS